MSGTHYICPICRTPLSRSENGKSLLCTKEEKPHCFDISSAGYVNLDRGHSGGGDSKECVRSRSAFLESGHYAPISDKINELVSSFSANPSLLLDAGCGEGYYTSSLARKMGTSDVIGIDISKPAVEHAAKAAKRQNLSNVSYAVSSIFELPIADGSLDGIVSIFAPCPENEFFRALKCGGYLFVAAAGERHLLGLKKAIYQDVYMNEARADMPSSGFALVHKESLSYKINLGSNDEILNLFAMTPYYYRTSLADKEKLSALTCLETEVDIELSVYRKNG
ncbi:MAG: methyltransferase domain-containing protein [Ruminococcaceae bacterium]|nr:methyltransferase domain-containing protein [Oscillospiraceae bacterium]